MSSPLLPERHPVRDFFVLDVLDVTQRSDIASMAHPIFSLSTKPETRILRYQQEDTIVENHPESKKADGQTDDCGHGRAPSGKGLLGGERGAHRLLLGLVHDRHRVQDARRVDADRIDPEPG